MPLLQAQGHLADLKVQHSGTVKLLAVPRGALSALETAALPAKSSTSTREQLERSLRHLAQQITAATARVHALHGYIIQSSHR